MPAARWFPRSESEDGAQTLEFALVAPAAVFLFFGVIYALLALAANVTLAHATSIAVRYASTPTDNIQPVYPADGQVESELFEATPFFTAPACTTTISGAPTPNAVVVLSVSCPFPNPPGVVLNGLAGLLSGGGDGPFAETLGMSATATGRRE